MIIFRSSSFSSSFIVLLHHHHPKRRNNYSNHDSIIKRQSTTGSTSSRTTTRSTVNLSLLQVFVIWIFLFVLDGRLITNRRIINNNVVVAAPQSKPYIPYRTSPYDQNSVYVYNWTVLVKELITHERQLRSGDSTGTGDETESTTENKLSKLYNTDISDGKQCPLPIQISISKRYHGASTSISSSSSAESVTEEDYIQQQTFAIRKAPVLQTIFPARGAGKQVIYTTQYEHVDLLTPSIVSSASNAKAIGSSHKNNKVLSSNTLAKEILIQFPDYPLLMESSSFVTSPIVADINGDGIYDIITTDYDGGITVVSSTVAAGSDGSSSTKPSNNNEHIQAGKKFFHHVQVPRLHVRREWFEQRATEEAKKLYPQDFIVGNTTTTTTTEEVNDTNATTKKNIPEMNDPYHSYFEFYYTPTASSTQKDVVRGVTANVFQQDSSIARSIASRKSQKDTLKQQKTIQYYQNEQKANPEQLIHLPLDHHQMEILSVGEQQQQQQQQQNTILNSTDQSDTLLQQMNGTTTTTTTTTDTETTIMHRRLQEVVDEGQQQQQQQQQQQHQAAIEDDEIRRAYYNGEINVENAADDLNIPEMKNEEYWDDDASGGNGKEPKWEEATEDHHRHHMEQYKQHMMQMGNDTAAADAILQNYGVRDGETDGVDNPTDSAMDSKIKQAQQILDEQQRKLDEEEHDKLNTYYDDYEYARYHGDDTYDRRDPYREDYNNAHTYYYHESNYIRITPHIVADPLLIEVPKMYTATNNEMEDILLVPVSYYLDEDEYEGLLSYNRFASEDQGDENEVKRGTFVASAIMAYTFHTTSPRWMAQLHLDLSTDYTAPQNATLLDKLFHSQDEYDDQSHMGAFALATPSVADIDGDGNPEVIIGTSMGIVYVFDARQLFKRSTGEGSRWPIQMQYPVEHRVLVEDVVGDFNLEVFVMDIGSNIVCFNHLGVIVWHRNLLQSIGIVDADNYYQKVAMASSPMSMGDIDGDGVLDIVVVFQYHATTLLFVINAATGADYSTAKWYPMILTQGEPTIPLGLELLHQKLPQPLLVDLHAESYQDFLIEYIRRNGTTPFHYHPPHMNKKKGSTASSSPPPYGGYGNGLHIVQPHGQELYIIEATTGCINRLSIGDEISAMVQVDDVHGTGLLDLVVATESGNIVTFETQVPAHPLNTWSNNDKRNFGYNTYVHGYSSSQGIYVHDISRQYVDIYGVYVPITFEIYDNRPWARSNTGNRTYKVEVRDGTSWQRPILHRSYDTPGIYTERVYIQYGPGYYTLSVILTTSHGLIYVDTFSIGYNVHFMDGIDTLVWFPLLLAACIIVIFGTYQRNHRTIPSASAWDDDTNDDDDDDDNNHDYNGSRGILGRALPS